MRLIIDSHLDLSWNALSWNRDQTLSLADLNAVDAALTDDKARGHCVVTLSEMRRGGIAVCLGTLLARARADARPEGGYRRTHLDYACQDIAYAVAQGQLAYYRLLAERGEVRLITTRRELQSHWQAWQRPDAASRPIGLIISMEGADPIVTPQQAEQWFQQGLRVVGLVHYGPGHYAMGTGQTGPLTPRGLELLKQMQRLGMILDLSHCCDDSFYSALDHFDGPVLSSHTNCRALVPGVRQYSDEQIRLLAQRNGVIGVVLDSWMLKSGYVKGQTPREQVPLSTVVDQIDHICQVTGSTRHVAIGSDLDGGFGSEQAPHGLDSIADLQKLEPILRSRGHADADIDAIFHGNWLNFFTRHLPDT